MYICGYLTVCISSQGFHTNHAGYCLLVSALGWSVGLLCDDGKLEYFLSVLTSMTPHSGYFTVLCVYKTVVYIF